MKPRSHSLNQVVCVTMTTIDATPTISVQMNATTCRNLRATVMAILKRLADAEVNAPVARFRVAVYPQVGKAIQLVAEVDARRTNRCQVPEPRSCGVHQCRRHPEGLVRHVAEVEERHSSELAKQRLADFGRSFQH